MNKRQRKKALKKLPLREYLLALATDAISALNPAYDFLEKLKRRQELCPPLNKCLLPWKW